MEETEWDAAGELGYMNMIILYFNALGIQEKLAYYTNFKVFALAPG